MSDEKISSDAVIIGSGIGGMSCAILLLKMGYRVTVIEKNREPGGMMRSYRRSGIDCPVGVHYIGSMGEGQPLKRMLDYLGISNELPIERMGLNGCIDKYIFDDFTFELPEGIDAFEDSLYQKFPDEITQIKTILNGLRAVSDIIYHLDFFETDRSNLSIIELFKPLGELLSELRCSKGLRSVLEIPCAWMGVPLDDCPVFYHHNILLSYLFSSWRLNCTGAFMSDLFARRIKELGGEIILGEGAEEIIIKNDEITGVRLKTGKSCNAPLVIAGIHPKSMLGLLPDKAVKPAYKKRISMIKDTTGIFSVHLGVDSSVHKALPYNIFSLINCKSELDPLVFYQLRNSENPDINLLTILTSSSYDDWLPWEKTVTGQRGDEYLQKKHEIAERLIQNASSCFGPLKGGKLLDSYTPLSIRDWVNSPGGSAYGVLRSKSQLLKTASLSRTSIKGLYLTGQSVMAPGVFGTVLGSLLTVKNIIGPEKFQSELLPNIQR